MEKLLDLIGNDGIFVGRLLLAMLLGGLVGIERQTRGRSAGLRTNILVCLGSAAIIVAFQKFALDLHMGAESAIRMDPARAASGVITGIGFLGAGTIIKSKDFVRGLTTAASIWVVSAIGVTAGLGEFIISISLTLLVLITLYVLHRLPITSDQYYSLHLKWHGDPGLLSEITEKLIKERVHINNRRVSRQPKTGKCEVVLSLRMRKRRHDNTIIDLLQNDERFDEISWS